MPFIYPPPSRIEKLIFSQDDFEFISKLDSSQGFLQIPITPESRCVPDVELRREKYTRTSACHLVPQPLLQSFLEILDQILRYLQKKKESKNTPVTLD